MTIAPEPIRPAVMYYQSAGALHWIATDSRYLDIINEVPAGFLCVQSKELTDFSIKFIPKFLVGEKPKGDKNGK
jgi:hypothetical protein